MNRAYVTSNSVMPVVTGIKSNQSIKTDLYSAVCRKRIRGARWQGLGGVSSIKQFRLLID